MLANLIMAVATKEGIDLHANEDTSQKIRA